jgi:uncharacterized protein (TIGR04255 family)
MRFAANEPWATLPGLLYAKVRDRYREQKAMPLAELPEEIRRHDAALAHLPLHQFISPDFFMQLGPRVVGLATRSNAYPGWPRIEEELHWLLPRIEAAGFVGEGERLGARYIDFFAHDIFPHLNLDVTLAGKSLGDAERRVSTVLRHEALTIRLAVTNSAVVGQQNEVRRGSVIDVDAWFAAPHFDLFTNGIKRFGEAHLGIKRLFFGLLRDEYLRSLRPRYA